MARWRSGRAVGLGLAALLAAVAVAYLATAGLVRSGNSPTVSIEGGEIPEGGAEVTRLSALDVGDPPLCGFMIDVTYDRLVNVATDCDADPEGNFDAALCNVDYAFGTVRVAGASAEEITGDIPLLDITWCGLGAAGQSSDLDVQIVSFVDCSLPPVDITPVADQDGVNVIVSGPPPVDTDSDDFDDCIEAYVGTDPFDDCADDPNDDAWPVDTYIDTWCDIQDVVLFVPHLNSAIGEPEYGRRFDLNVDGVVDIQDIMLLVPYLNTQCGE